MAHGPPMRTRVFLISARPSTCLSLPLCPFRPLLGPADPSLRARSVHTRRVQMQADRWAKRLCVINASHTLPRLCASPLCHNDADDDDDDAWYVVCATRDSSLPTCGRAWCSIPRSASCVAAAPFISTRLSPVAKASQPVQDFWVRPTGARGPPRTMQSVQPNVPDARSRDS